MFPGHFPATEVGLRKNTGRTQEEENEGNKADKDLIGLIRKKIKERERLSYE